MPRVRPRYTNGMNRETTPIAFSTVEFAICARYPIDGAAAVGPAQVITEDRDAASDVSASHDPLAQQWLVAIEVLA